MKKKLDTILNAHLKKQAPKEVLPSPTFPSNLIEFTRIYYGSFPTRTYEEIHADIQHFETAFKDYCNHKYSNCKDFDLSEKVLIYLAELNYENSKVVNYKIGYQLMIAPYL